MDRVLGHLGRGRGTAGDLMGCSLFGTMFKFLDT